MAIQTLTASNLSVGSPSLGLPVGGPRVNQVLPAPLSLTVGSPRLGDEIPRIYAKLTEELDEETGEPVQRSIFTNYNDGFIFEVESKTLVGRTDPGRGSVQKIEVVAPLVLANERLTLDAGPSSTLQAQITALQTAIAALVIPPDLTPAVGALQRQIDDLRAQVAQLRRERWIGR